MRIGIPKEIKSQEGRVALTPDACKALIAEGHVVAVQKHSGEVSGYRDEHYQSAGVQLVEDPETLYGHSELVVKVKEPQGEETRWLKRDQLLFCYLHLAAERHLIPLLLDSGVTAIGFELVEVDQTLPLLTPMSVVAGRLAAQTSTQLLHTSYGGKGLLAGGIEGTDSGHAVVIGGGQAGRAALRDLLCSGSQVTLLDINQNTLDRVKAEFPDVCTADSSDSRVVAEVVANADILIGAALIPGRRAPVVVSREMVRSMTPGSVIVDIAIDQGGCIETSRPTTHDNPTYIEEGQVHYCVTNMPGVVPRTSTQALSHAILPYVRQLASGRGLEDTALQRAIYLQEGEIQYAGLK